MPKYGTAIAIYFMNNDATRVWMHEQVSINADSKKAVTNLLDTLKRVEEHVSNGNVVRIDVLPVVGGVKDSVQIEIMTFLSDTAPYIEDFRQKVGVNNFMRAATVSHICHLFKTNREQAEFIIDLWCDINRRRED